MLPKIYTQCALNKIFYQVRAGQSQHVFGFLKLLLSGKLVAICVCLCVCPQAIKTHQMKPE